MRVFAAFLTLLVATPALADTIHCESPAKTAVIEMDVDFTGERDGGTITRVRAETEYGVMSTVAGETDHEPDTLAFGSVEYDRIQAGLESANVGPMTFTLDIVRGFDPEPGEGQDKDAVVAGVARIASIGTVTLTCTGW